YGGYEATAIPVGSESAYRTDRPSIPSVCTVPAGGTGSRSHVTAVHAAQARNGTLTCTITGREGLILSFRSVTTQSSPQVSASRPSEQRRRWGACAHQRRAVMATRAYS